MRRITSRSRGHNDNFSASLVGDVKNYSEYYVNDEAALYGHNSSDTEEVNLEVDGIRNNYRARRQLHTQ